VSEFFWTDGKEKQGRAHRVMDEEERDLVAVCGYRERIQLAKRGEEPPTDKQICGNCERWKGRF
jgi:hypothetical protein